MKRAWNITLTGIILILCLSTASLAFAQSPDNSVRASFGHTFSYATPGDTILNEPLPFFEGWLLSVDNIPDSSGESVINPKVVVNSSLNFVGFHPDDSAIFNPQPDLGVYTWDFDGLEIKETEGLPLSMWTRFGPVTMTPQLSAERSVVPEVLAAPKTLQDITVTLRLEEPLPPGYNSLGIIIGNVNIAYEQHRLVETRFVSQDSVDGWDNFTDGVRASWGTDDAQWLEIGKTFTFHAVLEANKSPDLLGSPIAKPYVNINYLNPIHLEPVFGKSVQLNLSESTKATYYSDNDVTWVPGMSSGLNYALGFSQVVSEITPPPPPFHVLLPADVRIEPEVLKMGSKGVTTAFIKLPEQYSVKDIDLSSVVCKEASLTRGVIAGDTLIVKFNRQELQDVEIGDEVELTVRGELNDGTVFKGSDVVRVIE